MHVFLSFWGAYVSLWTGGRPNTGSSSKLDDDQHQENYSSGGNHFHVSLPTTLDMRDLVQADSTLSDPKGQSLARHDGIPITIKYELIIQLIVED